MAAIDSVRIIIIGDSGVGKTSLVHLICHQKCLRNPGCTIGCSVEIYLHEYRAGTPSEKTFFVEFWDIGGSSSHKTSRAIFYNPVHGIILVHDASNRKSLQNLHKWLAEVLNRDKDEQGYEYDPEEFAGNQIPLLIVGTKSGNSSHEPSLLRSCRLSEECGADEILLDCQQVKSLAPASTNAVKLTRFLDKVIERRYYTREVKQSFVSASNSRRGFSLYSKGHHAD